MGIQNAIKKAVGKGADAIARTAALSPGQLEEVEAGRELYLSQMPDPTDFQAEELTSRLLAAMGVEIYNAYLPSLHQIYSPILPNSEYYTSFNPDYNIRWIRIDKWVIDQKENSLEKLINVYDVLSSEQCNIALVFHRTIKQTYVYLAVVNTQNADNSVDINDYKDRITDAIRGNFPGSIISKGAKGSPPCFEDLKDVSIATATNVPAEKSEKFVSQTIEKLLDGIIPETREEEYILVLLATPVLDVEDRKLRLSQMYTGLAPYSSWNTDFHYNESNSVSSSATLGVNVGASAGVQNGTNQAASRGTSESSSANDTTGESSSTSETQNTSSTIGSNESDTSGISETEGTNSSETIGGSGGFNFRIGSKDTFGLDINGSGNYSRTEGESFSAGTSSSHTAGSSISETTGNTLANTVGQSISRTLGQAITKMRNSTIGSFASHNLGVNFGVNYARSSSVTAMIGKNEGITQTFTNYTIKHSLELLDAQMKRYEQSTALGMWDFAAYIISEDASVASNVAHTYLALTQGENSYLSNSAVNTWRGNIVENREAAAIVEYLKQLRHPVFGLDPGVVEYDPKYYVYPAIVNACTPLSGKELAYALNFPTHSISGLPVIQTASFGRNVFRYNQPNQKKDKIHLGQVYHMYQTEPTPVNLDLQSLSSHTFVTGSTGSGKSNTIYEILQEATDQNIPFLVIEPAKGEYKHVFGSREDVNVFGTTPGKIPLLKLNPFSFPEEIHILEHLDRLVELFNVCWPMYAAMPAVLKKAVEEAYKDAGWDLELSENKYGEKIYPCFEDVASHIKKIIDSSEYDAENKGAYKGSLLTRVESLSNGINGLIFGSDETDPAVLFDKSAIIDLSRIGSGETRSLIMAMLINKLQEYRMAKADSINQPLRHLTVLEEAHNVLKKTPVNNDSESTGLMGKSVEMLSNAIAEMRTYGEGFIIADQAPDLLDPSVIRNTGTKIIMRLPDQNDRTLAAASSACTEEQMNEISRLPVGIAVVMQNDWIEPVLCQVNRFAQEDTARYTCPKPAAMKQTVKGNVREERTQVLKALLDSGFKRDVFKKALDNDGYSMETSRLPLTLKKRILSYSQKANTASSNELAWLIFELLEAETILETINHDLSLREWIQTFMNASLLKEVTASPGKIDTIMQCLLFISQLDSRWPREYQNKYRDLTEIIRTEGRFF